MRTAQESPVVAATAIAPTAMTAARPRIHIVIEPLFASLSTVAPLCDQLTVSGGA